MRPETDEELMNLYIQGDNLAFNELYFRHKAKVYGYLRKHMPTAQAADEVFQASFMKLHQSRMTFNQGEKFLPWMFTIVRNSLFDHLRKHLSESRKLEALKTEFGSTLHQDREHPRAGELETELSKLTAEQRELIDQRYIQGLEFSEIAEKSNSTPAAVRQSISRITRKLKNLIKGRSS